MSLSAFCRWSYSLRHTYSKIGIFGNPMNTSRCFNRYDSPALNKTIVSLSIKPKISLVDERIQIVIDGLQPRENITLKLNVTNQENLNYESLSHFIASKNGSVDLSKSAPINYPHYVTPDPMGIFWSMLPLPNSHNRFWSCNVANGLFCKFEAYKGHVSKEDIENDNATLIAEEDSVKRLYMANGVRRIVIKEGRVRGTLFLPPGPGPFPAIISLYGGILKGNVVEDKSAVLAAHGFASLALAFFGVEGLPKTYTSGPLDLDYFEEAIDLLLSMDEVANGKGIGLMGISKAGDVALSMTAFLPEHKIAATVAINCIPYSILSDVIYKGVKVLQGLQISKTEFERMKPVEGMENVFSTYQMFDVDNEEDLDANIIPFTKSRSDILMFVGLDDQLWPSERAVQFVKRFVEKEGKSNFDINAFQGLGHLVDLPFTPPCTIAVCPQFPYPTRVLYGGENTKLHSQAQERIWEETLTFFRRTLCK